MEGVLADALERVLGERPPLSAAGRTDAGVHARGQVISFATRSTIDPGGIRTALNGRLAPEVVVTRASTAPPGFDARFSATAREYRYAIRTAELPDPFLGRYEWHRPGDLSVGRMRTAAGDLVGRHDFASFCRRPGGGRSTVRTLHRLAVRRRGDLVLVDARADAFLHQMVRSLVGTLAAVGVGRIDPTAMPAILEARDRAAAGPVAPPHGLVLERVIYGRPARPRGGEL